MGDPDRGFGKRQPGGWIYSILPYLEQQALFNLPTDGNPNVSSPAQCLAAATLSATPLAAMICPSRRLPIPYPNTLSSSYWPYNAVVPQGAMGGRNDYAGSSGDQAFDGSWPGPSSLQDGDSLTYWTSGSVGDYQRSTGVIYLHSEVRIADISDGTSNTYLAGEKYMDVDHYLDGRSPAIEARCSKDSVATSIVGPI